MAQIIWTDPASSDLNTIAEYISLDKPLAAKKLVQKVLSKVELLQKHPQIGSKLKQLKTSHYRQLIIKPCRVIYRSFVNTIYIISIQRTERLFHLSSLKKRETLSGLV